MTSPKTPEWAEHWGREAVRLEMPCTCRLWALGGASASGFPLNDHAAGWGSFYPDLRDTLTELAVIPWVQAVALEVYGDVAVLFDFDQGKVSLTIGEKIRLLGRCFFDEVHPTLAEAAISAVAAMRGEA